MRYVIIGNSAAGIGAVEGIRQIDKQGSITLIASEPQHTYSRPLISYLLSGKVTEEKMQYRDTDFYEKNNCDLHLGVSVTEINAGQKSVLTDKGENIEYDKLLVATGSSAFVPKFEGFDTVKNKFTFMSLEDAQRLDKELNENSRVLIVGAGLIGLKCAEGISDRVKSITILDLSSRILPSILDDESAKIVQDHLENKGLTFLLSQTIKRFEENSAILENGQKLDFDIVVLAVGVRPNTGLLNGIAEIEQGIVINGKSETTKPDIYAAGDCTQTHDVSSGGQKVMALLPNAYIQGECAGINMAGGTVSFDKAIPMNAVNFFGLSIISAGSYKGETYKKDNYKCLFYSENKLNGYIMVGDIEKAGIYTSLIRNQIALDSIDFKRGVPGIEYFSQKSWF